MSGSTTAGITARAARESPAQGRATYRAHWLCALRPGSTFDFAEAEKVRPAGNDDAILRWNRCVRLVQNPAYEWGGLEQELVPFDAQDTPPR
jgi:hypothetical protein